MLKKISDLFNSNAPYIGVILSLFAVVGWGSATVFGKYLQSKNFKTNEIMSRRFFFGFLTACNFLFFPEKIFHELNNLFIRDIVILVLLSGVIGMFFYYRGLKRIPAKVATLVELFFPCVQLLLIGCF